MKKVLLVLPAVLAVLFLARGAVAKMAVSAGVKAVTGLRLEIRQLGVGALLNPIHVTGMKLHNPPDFPEKIMADVPELYVDADLPALLGGKTHLKELRLHFQELVVIKNRQGKTNLDALTAVKKAKKEPAEAKPPEEKKPGAFQVDKLRLKVGRVVFKDYSRGEPPTVREFLVEIDEEYSNITDPTGLASIILTRALVKTTIANLANFDLKALESQAFEALRVPVNLIGEQAGKVGGKVVDTTGQAVDALKGILGGEEKR